MVSVCMATYNGAEYIKEQIDSILMQLGDNDEVVISDDGSDDASLEIIKAYNDSRIKILHNTHRKGIIGNFENALINAKGDYIFLADQDDVWVDGKVARCLEELQSHDLILHDAVVVDGDKKVISNSFFILHNSKIGYWQNLLRNSYLGCCLAFRREMLAYILPIPPIAMHDIWIGLIISRKGRVKMMPEKLILYRRHGNNASSSSEKSTLTIGEKLSYRLKMFYYSITR